jgi:molybdate transport system substrate-binding protein
MPRGCCALLLATATFVAAPRALAVEMLVGAAASLRETMTAAGEAWTRGAPGRPVVRFDFAASSTLARQAEARAPFAALVLADEANMDRLARTGIIETATRADVLANTVVLIVPAPAAGSAAKPASVSGPRDLASPGVRRVALCDRAVPIGGYGRRVLDRFQLEDAVRAKLVRPDDARATLALVAGGAVDAGFVYATDAATRLDKVRVVWTASPEDGVDVRYPAAVVKGARSEAEARAFVAWLGSAPAQAIFRRYGFR